MAFQNQTFSSHKVKYLSEIAVIFSITIIAFLTYSNAIETGFQLDDQHMVEWNKQINDLSNYTKLDQWIGLRFNRVLPRLTLALDFYFHEYNVAGYHIVNICIHIINSILVFWIIKLIFQFWVIAKHRIAKFNLLIALFGAIIFTVHPMQMQAVTYITQRLASIAALFYLLGALLYIKGRLKHVQSNNFKIAFFYYFGVFLAFYFGMHSKQNIASLPLALFAIELFFVRDKNDKLFSKYIFIYALTAIIICLLFITFIGIPKAAESPSFSVYLSTEFKVLLTYIYKLFIPHSLQLYYNFQFSKTFFGYKEIVSLLTLIGILVTALILFKKYRLLSFGIIWFFITITVESSVFPQKFAIFEYRVYPGLLGFSIFLPAFIFYIFNVRIYPAIILVIAIIFTYANVTYQANIPWKNGITLWSDNVKKSPDYSIVYCNVGIYYIKDKKLHNAYAYFNKAIEKDIWNDIAYFNRGLIYVIWGELDLALKDINLAIQIKDKNALAYNNRGQLYAKLGEYSKAILNYKEAVSIMPGYHRAYSNLAIAYNAIGKFNEAVSAINRAIELDLNNPDYYNNRGNIHFSFKDYNVAAANYLKTTRLFKDHFQAFNNLGLINRIKKDYKKAVFYSTKAIKINPLFIDAYMNRALANYQMGKTESAIKDVEKCLGIYPNYIYAHLFKKVLLGEEEITINLVPAFVEKLEHQDINQKVK